MNISFAGKVVVPEGVLFRELEGEAVLLNLESESYFGLDEVGTRMWVLLTASDSIRDAFDRLLEEYEVDQAQLRQDVEDLLGNLLSQGLIEVRDAQLA